MLANPQKKYLNRVGLSVSKKLGGAVGRNRAKRLLRVACDLACVNVKGGYDLIIVARNRIDGKNSLQVTHDLKRAFDTLGLYSE